MQKLKAIWVWLRKNVLNKEMFLFTLVAEVIFWSPCIVVGILAITINPRYWTVFGIICVFWAGPFTPAMPLQFALAVGLKKLWPRLKRKHKQTEKCIISGSDVYNKNDGGENGQN